MVHNKTLSPEQHRHIQVTHQKRQEKLKKQHAAKIVPEESPPQRVEQLWIGDTKEPTSNQ